MWVQGLEYMWLKAKLTFIEYYFVATVWLRDFWKKLKEE